MGALLPSQNPGLGIPALSMGWQRLLHPRCRVCTTSTRHGPPPRGSPIVGADLIHYWCTAPSHAAFLGTLWTLQVPSIAAWCPSSWAPGLGALCGVPVPGVCRLSMQLHGEEAGASGLAVLTRLSPQCCWRRTSTQTTRTWCFGR